MKLDELKKSLMLMRGDLKLCSKPFQPPQQNSSKTGSIIVKSPIAVTNLSDVVINVHPQQIPYGLLALKSQWSGRLNLEVDVFTHSTINDAQVSQAAKAFAKKISTNTQSNLPSLKVTLIWNDVETPQLVTLPTVCPIFGEANILRYLNRVGPNEFYYETGDSYASSLSDALLDTCYQLSMKHPVKERQKHTQILSQRLGKNNFFSGSAELSLVDIVVASTLQKLHGNNSKELPANLSSWLKKTATAIGF